MSKITYQAAIDAMLGDSGSLMDMIEQREKELWSMLGEKDKRIAELEQELAIGVNVIRDYEERITELESDNRRMKKVMQRYIDSQDNAKNNWVLDFLQVLEIEK